MGTNAAQPLTVSIVTGVVVHRDAISNVCREQLEAVARHGRLHRRRVDVKAYACYTDVGDSRIVMAADAGAVAADEHFQASDLVLYHFGIYYPLFDSIHLVPRTARTVVTYYGITHPGLLPEKYRESVYKSYRQAANLYAADRILATSRFVAEELDRFGIPAERVTPLPLPVSFERLPDPNRRLPPSDVLRLAYVGRFISSKGVLDLLRAVEAFRWSGCGPVQLDLVGSATFSDQTYLRELQQYARERDLDGILRFHFDVPDAELAEVLLAADALVLPSFHEGFCVPVIEAMACGCFPVCSDAGALPETSGGLGRTFRVGDVDHLAARLRELAAARAQGGYLTDSGFLPRGEWVARARAYSLGFARDRFHERFWAAVLDDLAPPREEVKRYLIEARRQALAGLRPENVAPPPERSLYGRVAEVLAASAAAKVPETLAG